MLKDEWKRERDRDRLAQMLDDSAKAVRDAVEGRLKSGREMDRHYDHPILMLQHLIWHDGYHHGQIKLALKMAGRPIADDDAGPGTWASGWKRRNKESDHGKGGFFHPANLLIHRQKIETVPPFHDAPVPNPANRDAGELDWMVCRWPAKGLPNIAGP
jgi:hypothetical protein